MYRSLLLIISSIFAALSEQYRKTKKTRQIQENCKKKAAIFFPSESNLTSADSSKMAARPGSVRTRPPPCVFELLGGTAGLAALYHSATFVDMSSPLNWHFFTAALQHSPKSVIQQQLQDEDRVGGLVVSEDHMIHIEEDAATDVVAELGEQEGDIGLGGAGADGSFNSPRSTSTLLPDGTTVFGGTTRTSLTLPNKKTNPRSWSLFSSTTRTASLLQTNHVEATSLDAMTDLQLSHFQGQWSTYVATTVSMENQMLKQVPSVELQGMQILMRHFQYEAPFLLYNFDAYQYGRTVLVFDLNGDQRLDMAEMQKFVAEMGIRNKNHDTQRVEDVSSSSAGDETTATPAETCMTEFDTNDDGVASLAEISVTCAASTTATPAMSRSSFAQTASASATAEDDGNNGGTIPSAAMQLSVARSELRTEPSCCQGIRSLVFPRTVAREQEEARRAAERDRRQRQGELLRDSRDREVRSRVLEAKQYGEELMRLGRSEAGELDPTVVRMGPTSRTGPSSLWRRRHPNVEE
ncbi:unnamed protein product [Amoebophrya sp. A120]|nr:unnamed protein product [Amoebophrya sp. A120]|eukprot:GSA120T00014502001.1